MFSGLRTLVTSRREWLGAFVGAVASSRGVAQTQISRNVCHSVASASIDAVDAGAAERVAATVRLRGGVSPVDFEGGDLDTKLDSAITYAIERIAVLDLRGLPTMEIARPMVLSRSVAAGETNWVAPKSVLGGGVHIVARAPMRCMVELRNAFGVVMQGLRIDGRGMADMLLDTSWDISAAPAANCRWSDLELRGARGPVSWNANGNNDCDFAFVQVQGPTDQPGHIAIRLECGGGDLALFRVRCYWGKLLVAAQSIALTNCVTAGIKAIGHDFNLLSVIGGYHYPAADSRTNIELAGRVPVMALAVEGAHIENGRANGVVLGGDGLLFGGATFIQCHIFAPGNPGGVRLLGPAITGSMGSGIHQTVRLIGGTVQLVDLSDTPAVALSLEGVNHDQTLLSRRRAGGELRILEDAEAGLYRQEHPSWGPLGTLRSTATALCTAGSEAHIKLTDWPTTGRLVVRATDGRGPRAIFDYDIPSATVISTTKFGQGSIHATIRGDGLLLSHDIPGVSTAFLVAAIGV